MRIRISTNGFDVLKKMLKETQEGRLRAAAKFLVRHLAEEILAAVKSKIPDGDLESIYKEGLYVAEVTGKDPDRVAYVITVRPSVWSLSNFDASTSVVKFSNPDPDTPSYFANQIAMLWTADTLPKVVDGYSGNIIVRLGRREEVQEISKARQSGGYPDTRKLDDKLKESGFSTSGADLIFNSKPFVDLKFYVRQMEFGDDPSRQHWRPSLREATKNRPAFMRALSSGHALDEAMEILSDPRSKRWRTELRALGDTVPSEEIKKFSDFSKSVLR